MSAVDPETGLIAGLVSHGEHIAACFSILLEPWHFNDPQASAAYKAAIVLFSKGSPINATTLAIDAPGLASYFDALAALEVSADLIPTYAAMVKRGFVKRGLCAAMRTAHDELDKASLADDTDLAKIASRLAISAHGAKTPLKIPTEAAIECAADVTRVPVEWLWNPYIPLGKIAYIEGDPGLGKTFLALQLCAAVTNNLPMPDQQGKPTAKVHQGHCIFLSSDDAPEDTLCERLENAGADLSRVHFIHGLKRGQQLLPITMQHIDELERAFRDIQPALVIFDPLQAYLGADVDMHRQNETSPVMTNLRLLAQRQSTSIVAIRHYIKGAAKAIHKAAGSGDIAGKARSIIGVVRDPDDPSKRIAAHAKSSLCKEGVSLSFQVVEPGKIEWLGVSSKDAEEAVNGDSQETRERSVVRKAEEFLRAELEDGPRPVMEVYESAKSAKISERSIDRARETLKTVSKKQSGKKGPWMLSLPSLVTVETI